MNKALLASTALAHVAFPAGVIVAMASESIEDLEARLQEIQAECEEIEAGEPDDSAIASLEAKADEADKLTRRIEAKRKISALNAGQGRKSLPEPEAKGGQGGGRQKIEPTIKPNARTGGFAHLGEFASAIRAHSMGNGERATQMLLNMNEGVGEDGGFLVPPEFREGIMKVVEGEESLLSRTDGSTTARNAVMHPKDETTPWGSSGIQAYWEGEGQAANASGAKFQGDTLRLNKLFARVDVTDELLEDAPQLDNYLRVKTPEVMTSVINLAIIQGNGVGKPLGFMNSGALVTVSAESSQPADTVHHRNIVKMWSRMYAPCRRNAIWLINQDVEPSLDLMSFKDATDSPVPIYLPAGTIAGQGFSTLKGRPVIPVQGMETVGDLGDIALVDLTKYRTITKAGGTRVDTSIHLKFDTDETVFRFIFRLAGAPWWSAPIDPRDGTNTLSPFVALASR